MNFYSTSPVRITAGATLGRDSARRNAIPGLAASAPALTLLTGEAK